MHTLKFLIGGLSSGLWFVTQRKQTKWFHRKKLHHKNLHILRIMAKYCWKNIISVVRWIGTSQLPGKSGGASGISQLTCITLTELQSTWSREMKQLRWNIKTSHLEINGLRPLWITPFYVWTEYCKSSLLDKKVFMYKMSTWQSHDKKHSRKFWEFLQRSQVSNCYSLHW